ncbi:ABC transporter ATP-binding protein [Sporolactobacillus sp. STCC-11]|uniref:ABC transporter ATP-binding protein n=1 Tax=Sporolactobacillus caesalpiniae TaxID=3230362 RepID=UPI00339346B9
MIQLEKVTFSYNGDGLPVIQDLSLSVNKGECVVITGKSGCGKTTITRLINGLATHFYNGSLSGRVIINGVDQRDFPFWSIGRRVGAVLQDPSSQFFAEKAADEIAFGCENYGMPRHEMMKRISIAAEKSGSSQLLDKSLFHLSSGQQQCLAIASIYAVNPDVYVFDEPSANLDSAAVERLSQLISVLKNEGKTIIIAEHRLFYLTHLADRILYMENGQLTRHFSSAELRAAEPAKLEQLGLRFARLPKIRVSEEIQEKETVITIDRLNFSYKNVPVIHDFCLQIGRGEIIALRGPNGAGKTTLAKLVCGLLKQKTGNIWFRNRMNDRKQRRKQIFFVMQHTDSQLFAESAREEVRLSAKKPEKAESILASYGLAPFKASHPSTLSGGQKQRLLLAVAESMDSSILILDEPTSGLDGETMRLLAERLRVLAARGKAILVISHDQEFIASTCTRIIHMEQGQKIKDEAIIR